jgi:hypothetical protein
MEENEARGFPGMIGSLDCMHWEWKNCPKAWAGQFKGRHTHPTVILEAVASKNLWIWHAFFGVAGSNNDINVLQRSPLARALAQRTIPQVPFLVNGQQHQQPYFLTDGIYPEWAVFVKAFRASEEPEKILFTQKQESVRKDIERAFGVLQVESFLTNEVIERLYLLGTLCHLEAPISLLEVELHGRVGTNFNYNAQHGRRTTRDPGWRRSYCSRIGARGAKYGGREYR